MDEVEEEKHHHHDDDEEEAPSSIKCRSTVLDIDYHPSQPLICCGLVSSELEIWKQSTNNDQEYTRLARITGLHRREACRTLAFNVEGSTLFTGGADGSLHAIDCTEGKVVWTCLSAHEEIPVNRISTCLSVEFGPWSLVSGDENGTIKVWDCRDKPDQAKFNFPSSHLDFVSDICYVEEEKRVLTTGGDGTLSVFDLRKPTRVKGEARSEELDTELLSLVVIKNGKRVLCGTQEGPISIFTWGTWDFPADSINGHPHSVDCLLKLDEDTILTGSSDGIIRVVRVLPNKLLGVIGYHDDFPVERMKWSFDKRLVASCSHDNLVRFWDTGFLIDGMHELPEMELGDGAVANGTDDEDDYDDENSDDEDRDELMKVGGEDSSDEDAKKKVKAKSKKKNAKAIFSTSAASGGKKKKQKPNQFFEDL